MLVPDAETDWLEIYDFCLHTCIIPTGSEDKDISCKLLCGLSEQTTLSKYYFLFYFAPGPHTRLLCAPWDPIHST